MGECSFVQEITRRNRELGLHLCVGLDTDGERVKKILGHPTVEGAICAFNRAIVSATKHVAAVFKPNLWFYLEQGHEGLLALIWTVRYVQEQDVPVIIDTKYGDIGKTSEKAAHFLFDVLGANAVTANPYLGADAVAPLLARADRGIIFLCVTSNPGRAEFQDRCVHLQDEERAALARSNPVAAHAVGAAMYQIVAHTVATRWNERGNCGLVTGATFPSEIGAVRNTVGPDLPLLIPGVGKQKGDLEGSVKAAQGKTGDGVYVINISTAIGEASSGSNFAEAGGKAAENYHRQIVAAKAA